MSRVRVRGLVKLASSVRSDLSRPLDEGRRARLRDVVRRSLVEIEAALQRAGTTPAALPAPSRRAYTYLRGLDLDALPLASAQPGTAEPQATHEVREVRLAGLKRDLELVLDTLDRAATPERRESALRVVAGSHAAVARAVGKLEPGERLTEQSAATAAWLAYFASPERGPAYLQALDRARPLFADAFAKRFERRLGVHLHFRPMRGIYRWRREGSAVRVKLPAPMVCFDEELFAELAAAATERGGDQRRIQEAMAGEAYQAVRTALEPDLPDQSQGVAHDLQASFDRVNQRYFSGRMKRPRLTWSRTLTRRKFGHYNELRDTLMLSATLDQPHVSKQLVDYVMFHELLHKRHGVYWIGQRRYVHTPEFMADERRFEGQAEAEAALGRLARER